MEQLVKKSMWGPHQGLHLKPTPRLHGANKLDPKVAKRLRHRATNLEVMTLNPAKLPVADVGGTEHCALPSTTHFRPASKAWAKWMRK